MCCWFGAAVYTVLLAVKCRFCATAEGAARPVCAASVWRRAPSPARLFFCVAAGAPPPPPPPPPRGGGRPRPPVFASVWRRAPSPAPFPGGRAGAPATTQNHTEATEADNPLVRVLAILLLASFTASAQTGTIEVRKNGRIVASNHAE